MAGSCWSGGFLRRPCLCVGAASDGIRTLGPLVEQRFGVFWKDFATIGVFAFLPFTAYLVRFIADRVVTPSASQRLANAIAWYESWPGDPWQFRMLNRMDGDDYAACEGRTLVWSFLFSLSVTLFVPLVDFSAWWLAVPAAVGVGGTYWIWMGR